MTWRLLPTLTHASTVPTLKRKIYALKGYAITYGKRITVKKILILDEPLSQVFDLWCDMQSVSTKFEPGNMVICGTAVVCLITGDDDNKSAYSEKAIDFEYRYPIKCSPESLRSEPEIEMLSCGYTITGAQNIELRIDIGINAAIYECRKMSLITDIEIDENTPAQQTAKCAMTIYFTGEGKCVWDIAKHYNASVNEIMKINELESEMLCPRAKCF